ncbi:uncharacterized protein A4U43_C08F35550 [Asparagus officinalis]|nr:uncharacterized protein A4U43_C08F35550 [Asparagus officinalis]
MAAAGAQLAELLCLDTSLLRSSLPNRLKPNFELLSSVIGDVQRTYAAFRRNSRLMSNNLETNFLPNVKTLRSYEVPDEKITFLAAWYPRTLMLPAEKFGTVVASIAKFGFDPSSTLFVQGVSALGGLEPCAWEKKVALYKSLGWSAEEIVSAFRKQPFCMSLSEEKMRKVAGFFTKEMSCSPSLLATKPVLLCLSFERRILPRCSVLSVLVSKGLLTRELGQISFLKVKTERFLAQYLAKYAERAPEILEVYEGRMTLQDFNIQFMNL